MKKKIVISGILLFTIAAIGARPVRAENGNEKSVLKSTEIKSMGRIRGQEDFYYDGEDIYNLSEAVALLYRSCQ